MLHPLLWLTLVCQFLEGTAQHQSTLTTNLVSTQVADNDSIADNAQHDWTNKIITLETTGGVVSAVHTEIVVIIQHHVKIITKAPQCT